MRILISTPLFPPETAYPAAFAKNLSLLLSEKNIVTVLAFVEAPEKVDNVNIISVSKKQNLAKRLTIFTYRLFQEVKNHDLVIVKQAGISSLLTVIVSKLFGKYIILKMKEDEVIERIRQFSLKEKSFKVWQIAYTQKIVLKFSNIVIFDNLEIQNILQNRHNLRENKLKVATHPEQKHLPPFLNEENLQKEKQVIIKEWESYLKFLEKHFYE